MLSSAAPSFLARLFRTRSWRAHAASVHELIATIQEAETATKAAQIRYTAAVAEEERRSAEHQAAQRERDALRRRAAELTQHLESEQAHIGGSIPDPGFWAQSDDELQRASPWNGGRFREARDTLFAAAIRLHKAFVIAAARPVKESLDTVARAALRVPGAPKPSSTDWGVFFLVVPVVSTTFHSFDRMFECFRAAEIGWLLVDEAGQAPPQWAVGAIWRAKRAVVIGDPLQIEPVVTTPRHTTRLIFEQNGAHADAWAAPEQSAQTLADRATRIQGRFRAPGDAGTTERITGIPLLVHRRCERPMFDLANRIAYGDRMVFATDDGSSPIREILGQSAWIDVGAPSTDKWVEAEGRLIVEAICKLCRTLSDPPYLYVICPFKYLLRD